MATATKDLFRALILLCVLFWSSIASTDTRDFFVRWQEQLRIIEKDIQDRFRERDHSSCNGLRSYHACGDGPFEGAQCEEHSGITAKLCTAGDCKVSKLDLKETYVETPEPLAFGSFEDNAKNDICFTQGLVKSFKEARNYSGGVDPWTYFGTSQNGVFRVWPGSPRENIEDSAKCKPYDPRVRPWWAVAARKPRNLIIMIDMSKRMQDNFNKKPIQKWELTMNMTMQLLDTLSERDMVNVIIYDINATTLLNFDKLMEANETTITRLKTRLRALTPTWDQTLDIAEALDLAFKVFRNFPRDPAPEFAKCENHIVLFADNRDCVKSQWPNCSLRERNNLESYSRIVNATEWFLSFADTLKEEMRRLRGTRVSLYPFSLSPHASAWMSQLACRLDGIHVDLAKELDKGIIDPLALMREYFRRIALPIAMISEKPRMVVSPNYDDSGGLGEMNTFAMPVFYQAKPKCPPLLYGVIGTDMPLSIYSKEGIQNDKSSFDLERGNWNGDRASCSSSSEVSRCHLQSLRGTDNQCVYRKDNRKESKCFKYNNNYYYLEESRARSFVQARDFCENEGGYMIAPKRKKERRVLTSVIPPDGVWVNLRYNDTQWYWPDNEQLNANQADSLDKSKSQDLDVLAIMVPHSFDQNFQWTQDLTFQYTMCKFDKKPPSYLCSDKNTTTLVDNDEALNTIKSCGLDECFLEELQAFKKSPYKEIELLYNLRSNGRGFADFACCSQDEQSRVCNANPSSSDDNDNENTSIVVISVCVGIAVLILLCLLLGCILKNNRGTWTFNFTTTGKPGTGSNDQTLQLVNHKYGINPAASPFVEPGAADHLRSEKRPALVVNIEVNVLDNGWEKVGGYGRVRQGEYVDNFGNVHKVAVKFVDVLAPEAAWEALKNEFDILASIPIHPNIVKPIGAHWGDRSAKSQRYIVEELMHSNFGDFLHGDIAHTYPGLKITYKHLINIFIDIASGLEHLHKHKIIHFDMKPKNVLLDENLRAKIADFGCSKAKYDTYIALSQMGGTPPYMPPECWMLQYAQNNRTEVSRIKIDVYSFGVVMWESLNGGHSIGSVFAQTTVPSSSIAAGEETKEGGTEANTVTTGGDGAGSSDIMTQRWEIKYQLSNTIPETLRNLVNSCVRADFDARPTCFQILETLKPMLDTDWADKPISFG